jgi:hypothetical protein
MIPVNANMIFVGFIILALIFLALFIAAAIEGWGDDSLYAFGIISGILFAIAGGVYYIKKQNEKDELKQYQKVNSSLSVIPRREGPTTPRTELVQTPPPLPPRPDSNNLDIRGMQNLQENISELQTGAIDASKQLQATASDVLDNLSGVGKKVEDIAQKAAYTSALVSTLSKGQAPIVTRTMSDASLAMDYARREPSVSTSRRSNNRPLLTRRREEEGETGYYSDSD